MLRQPACQAMVARRGIQMGLLNWSVPRLASTAVSPFGQRRCIHSSPIWRQETVQAESIIENSPPLTSSAKYGMELPLLRAICHAARRIQKRHRGAGGALDPTAIAKGLPAGPRMSLTLGSPDGTVMGVANQYPELFQIVEVEDKAKSSSSSSSSASAEDEGEPKKKMKKLVKVLAATDFGLEEVVAKVDAEISSAPLQWHSMEKLQNEIVTEEDLQLILATGYENLPEFLLFTPSKFRLSADLEAFGGPQASGDPTAINDPPSPVNPEPEGFVGQSPPHSNPQKPLFISGYGNLPAPLPVIGQFRSSPDTGSLMRMNTKFASAKSGDQYKALQVLTAYLPSVYFVPLVVVEKTIPEDTLAAAMYHCPECANLQEVLMDMPAELTEVKVLGDQPTDVFVRLIGMDVPFSPNETADELYSQYFLSQSQAMKLHSVLLGTAPGGPHHDLTTSKQKRKIEVDPTSVADLEKLLPPKLFRSLPLKGAAAILLFLRLPHLFQVDTERYEIQPRRVVGCHDDTGDLVEFTIESSPCPRTIRMIQRLQNPTSILDLEPQLPAPVKLEIQNSVGELKNFVASHRMYCYIKEDGEGNSVIWTRSMTMRKMEDKRLEANPDLPKSYEAKLRQKDVKRMLEKQVDTSQLLREIFHILPYDGSGVSLQMLLRRLTRRSADVLKNFKSSRSFFESMPDKVIVTHKVGTGYAKYVLFRKETTTRLPDNMIRPCRDIHDITRELAMISCGKDGQWVPTLVQFLSPECRDLIRAMGGIDAVFVSCSSWFCYVKGTTAQSGWVRYIGHLKEAEKEIAREQAKMVGVAENRSLWKPSKLHEDRLKQMGAEE